MNNLYEKEVSLDELLEAIEQLNKDQEYEDIDTYTKSQMEIGPAIEGELYFED
jgi:hypothetical protein